MYCFLVVRASARYYIIFFLNEIVLQVKGFYILWIKITEKIYLCLYSYQFSLFFSFFPFFLASRTSQFLDQLGLSYDLGVIKLKMAFGLVTSYFDPNFFKNVNRQPFTQHNNKHFLKNVYYALGKIPLYDFSFQLQNANTINSFPQIQVHLKCNVAI